MVYFPTFLFILIIIFSISQFVLAESNESAWQPSVGVGGFDIGEDGYIVDTKDDYKRFLRKIFTVQGGYTDYQYLKAGGPQINKLLGGTREALLATALGLYLQGKDKKRRHRRVYEKNKKLALQLLAATFPLGLLEMGILEHRTRNIPERPPKELMDKIKKEYEEKQQQLEERYKHSANQIERDEIDEPATTSRQYKIGIEK